LYIYDSPRKKLTFIVIKLHPSNSKIIWLHIGVITRISQKLDKVQGRVFVQVLSPLHKRRLNRDVVTNPGIELRLPVKTIKFVDEYCY
jgi:hypothetical protein